jgi:hypothetical protein
MMARSAFVGFVLAVMAMLAAGCGGNTPAPANITVHGQVEPGSATLTSGLEKSYSGCASDRPTPGTQITVVDASGKVIGNSTLGTWSHKAVSSGGLTIYPCWEPFTMTVPSDESRYGIQINGVPGTRWTTNVRTAGGMLLVVSTTRG